MAQERKLLVLETDYTLEGVLTARVKQLEAVFTELLSVRHATSRSSANSSGEDAMSMLVQWDQATQRQKSQHPNHK